MYVRTPYPQPYPHYFSHKTASIRRTSTIALRFSLSSKATTRGGRLNSMHPQDYRDSAREAASNMFDWRDRSENRSGPMATAKPLKAAILARRASQGPRRKTSPMNDRFLKTGV